MFINLKPHATLFIVINELAKVRIGGGVGSQTLFELGVVGIDLGGAVVLVEIQIPLLILLISSLILLFPLRQKGGRLPSSIISHIRYYRCYTFLGCLLGFTCGSSLGSAFFLFAGFLGLCGLQTFAAEPPLFVHDFASLTESVCLYSQPIIMLTHSFEKARTVEHMDKGFFCTTGSRPIPVLTSSHVSIQGQGFLDKCSSPFPKQFYDPMFRDNIICSNKNCFPGEQRFSLFLIQRGYDLIMFLIDRREQGW